MKTPRAMLHLLMTLLLLLQSGKGEQEEVGNEPTTKLPTDTSTKLCELIALMAEQRIELKYAKTQIEALKARLEASESIVDQIKKENQAQALNLTAMETRLRASEDTVEAQRTQMLELKTLNEENKVAFSLSLETTTDRNSGHYNTGKTLIYKQIFSNVGDAYNRNTGFFTAPVKGVYEFSLSALNRGSNVILEVYLRKNRERVVSLYSTFKSEHNNVSNGASLLLEVGDVVDVYLPANRRVLDNRNHHTTFRGHLLFQM